MHMRFRRPSRVAIVSLAVVMSAALGGCADGDSDGGSGSGSDDGPLRVATLGFADFLLPRIAEDQGFFEDEGVDVELIVAGGGSVVQIPQIVNGELDVGASGLADILPSIAQGLPLNAIANVGSAYNNDIDKTPTVFLAKDSGIQEACDLEGKKVGLNSVGTSQELAVRAIIKDAGCDPDKATFVQVPAANIPAAVDAGQVDAGQGIEPYASVGIDDLGLHPLFSDADAYNGGPALTYFVKRDNAEGRSEDLDAFARAMQRATDLVAEDLEILRKAVLEHAEVAPELVAKMTRFPHFTNDIGPERHEELMKFSLDNGQIAKELPVEDWLYVPK